MSTITATASPAVVQEKATTAAAASSSAATSQSTSSASSSTSSSSTSSATRMGSQDFLNLLVTQLRYQNPMNPEDPKDFVAQLAQFTNVEQLVNMNTKMDSLSGLLQTGQANQQVSQGVALLGKTVKAAGSTIAVTSSKVNAAAYWLGQDASAVKVDIYDVGGNKIRTMDLGKQTHGENNINWDGKDDSGKQVADGTYAFKVTATDSAGKVVDVTSFVSGEVTEVVQDSTNKKVYLRVNGNLISLDQIITIDQT